MLMLQIYKFSYNLFWLAEFYLTNATGDSHFKITYWLHSKIAQIIKNDQKQELEIAEYNQTISPWRFKVHCLFARPFVIRGGAKNWPATKKWNMDFFCEKYPNVKVPFLDETNASTSSYHELTLKEAIDSFRNGQKKYCKFSNLLYLVPKLQKDLNYSTINKLKPTISQKGTLQFFLGPGAIKTRLHCALGHNFFTQIHGVKVWRIYPKRYTQFFLPSLCRTPHYISHEEYEFPHLKDATKDNLSHWKVELNSGDILFNPSFLWHTVETPVDSIAVKSSWASLSSFTYNPVQSLMTLTSLGLNPLKLRKDFDAGFFFPKKWF